MRSPPASTALVDVTTRAPLRPTHRRAGATLTSLLALAGLFVAARGGQPLGRVPSAEASVGGGSGTAGPRGGSAVVPPSVPADCTYTTNRWNVRLRRAVASVSVRHPYAALTPAEIDPATGCTVCREDQRLIEVPGLAPLLLCKKVADDVERVLRSLVEAGANLDEAVGYRVGKTRGPIDAQGNRTVFSNHAFGAAIDLNARANGLYAQCPAFGPHCRLLHGGPWRPGAPGAFTADGPVVAAFRAMGWRWGGTADGDTKDFMHFSPTGH